MALRQIINGSWQDALGNPLALGYLTFRLNTDGQAGVQVVAGRLVTVDLDAFGNIAGVVSLWTNASLVPAGTVYDIRAYTVLGQEVWRNPKFTLPAGSGAYDFGGVASPAFLLLETGGYILLENGGRIELE